MFLSEKKNVPDREKVWVGFESLRSGVSADGFSGFSSATLQAWSPDLEADLQNTKYRKQKVENRKQEMVNRSGFPSATLQPPGHQIEAGLPLGFWLLRPKD